MESGAIFRLPISCDALAESIFLSRKGADPHWCRESAQVSADYRRSVGDCSTDATTGMPTKPHPCPDPIQPQRPVSGEHPQPRDEKALLNAEVVNRSSSQFPPGASRANFERRRYHPRLTVALTRHSGKPRSHAKTARFRLDGLPPGGRSVCQPKQTLPDDLIVDQIRTKLAADAAVKGALSSSRLPTV
jgi:hypothetical protein